MPVAPQHPAVNRAAAAPGSSVTVTLAPEAQTLPTTISGRVGVRHRRADGLLSVAKPPSLLDGDLLIRSPGARGACVCPVTRF
ncbi:MAG: hypothetical protein ACM3ML_17945 [Micromonosporaceae bacterium]